MNQSSKRYIPIIAAAWAVLLTAGFKSLDSYDYTPTPSGTPKQTWPSSSLIKRVPAKATFVLFLHPHCPCSSASIHCLTEVMANVGNQADFIAVFVRPKDAPRDWEKAELYQKCLQLPTLNIVVDEQGLEASRFGAKSSGQTYIYRADNLLAFSGGITNGRGMQEHGNEWPIILAALNKPDQALFHTPVYGCSLQ